MLNFYTTVGLLLTTASVAQLDNSCTTSCHHRVNQTAPLKYLDRNPDLDLYAKPGHWFTIGCCADGFTDIEWYFHKPDNNTWTQWPWHPCDLCPDPYNPDLCDQDQKLEFIYVYGHRDSGEYKCVLTNQNTGQRIRRQFHLDVAACHEHPTGDIIVDKPQSPVHAALGSNLTLTCQGYFGCPIEHQNRQANWTYTDASGRTHPLLSDQEGEHFHVQYNSSVRDIEVASILTIVHVRKSDYGLVFHCQLSSNKTTKHWHIVIAPAVNKLNLKLIIILVSSLGVVTLLMIATMVLYCCHKPQVDFRRRSFLGQLPVKGPDEESCYDAIVIHHEDNRGMVEDAIRKPLTDEKYNICTKDCILGGQGEVSGFTDAIARSMCVIIVLSDKELDFMETHLHLGVAITCPKIVPMVVVEIQIGEARLDRSLKKDVLKHLPHITTSVQWHGRENMSRRQLENFICTIKSNLPLPTKSLSSVKGDSNDRAMSDSSTAPLVNRELSVASTTSINQHMKPMFDSSISSDVTSRQNSTDPARSEGFVEGQDDDVFEEATTPLVDAPDHWTNIPARKNDLDVRHPPNAKSQCSNDSGYAKSPQDQYEKPNLSGHLLAV